MAINWKEVQVNFGTYQQQARLTRLESANSAYAILNLGGEVGEVLSLMAKFERDGPEMDFHDKLKKELGDVLWHIAAICDDFGFDLEDVASGNLEKLRDRQARNTLQGSGDNR